MQWLDWGVVGAFLMLVLTLLLVVGDFVWSWGLGGWMEYRDRRSARSREEAEADLAEYGPTAVGLRDELLPEDLRQMVLAERARAEKRWGRRWVLH
jgi:hypothetical protein